jgi:cell division protein FtsN
MNDHNLDDLIIGEPGMGSRRTRNILAVAALLIIVLIAGITLSRLFFGETTENTELARAEVEELVTPEPVAAKTASTEKKETFPKRDIPDELKPLEEEKLPETPAKTTPPESNVKTENKKASISDTVTKKTEKPKTEKKTPSAAKKTDQAAKKKKSVEKPKEKPKQTEAKPSAAKKAPAAKTSAKKAKPVAKKSAKPSQLFKKTAAGKGGKYYIQIGSFGKIPDDDYLKGIKAKGFQYTIVEKEGRFKVWVGPYSSYEASKAKLPEVKEKLNPSAFTVRKQ